MIQKHQDKYLVCEKLVSNKPDSDKLVQVDIQSPKQSLEATTLSVGQNMHEPV